MRALAPLLALAALLLAALPAAADEPCEARVCAEVGYPGPGVRLEVYEHPDCVVHQVLWAGAWMSAADASRWAWSDRSPAGAGALDDRAAASLALVLTKAAVVGADAAAHGPAFLASPIAAAFWAADTAGHEDVCALGVVDLTSGMGWI